MHRFDEEIDEVIWAVFRYALDRIKNQPPLDGPRPAEELWDLVGQSITPEGLGGSEALAAYADHLAPACISADHPRFLSFVPVAPTKAAAVFDLVVGASSLCGSSWLDGSGAVFAENQALRWVADLAGLPDGAGGCFVSGGTMANLSALVTARHAADEARGPGTSRPRWAVVAAESAHSSVASAARVMDVDVLSAPVDVDRRLRGDALQATIDRRPAGTEVFAVVATAGTTNLGTVDAIDEVAAVAAGAGVWLHVDAAYGGAGLAAPSVRQAYAGIERCDSMVVDPHKWLFAPYDCAALVYRDPAPARAAHTQHADYLDPIINRDEWNPSDYAHVLTRRVRGLPFWFSLAVHGTDAYRDAVERTLEVARAATAMVRDAEHLELVDEPTLSVVVFRRLGWSADDYTAWSDRMLADGTALVVPTKVDGETVLRFCIVNPVTTEADIAEILQALC